MVSLNKPLIRRLISGGALFKPCFRVALMGVVRRSIIVGKSVNSCLVIYLILSQLPFPIPGCGNGILNSTNANHQKMNNKINYQLLDGVLFIVSLVLNQQLLPMSWHGHPPIFSKVGLLDYQSRPVNHRPRWRSINSFLVLGSINSHSFHTHRIHVWYVSLHLVDFYGKCR